MSRNWKKNEEITAQRLNDTGMGLKVVAQQTPNMTIRVNAGVAIVNGITVKYNGGNSGSFTAPATNPRIDIVTISDAGVIGITQGTESASPSAPAYPADKTVLAEIYLRAGTTQINDTDESTHGYIYRDCRPLGAGITLIDSSTGAADAGKGIKTDANGLIDLSFIVRPKIEVFTSNGTFTKDARAKLIKVICIGSGGNGGNGGVATASANREGGTGGGGGSRTEALLVASQVTETVAVNVANGGAGNAGAPTSFGTYLKAYNGGNGAEPYDSQGYTAGTGAGTGGNGLNAAYNTSINGGLPSVSTGSGIGGSGGGSVEQADGGNGEYGGGAGGGSSSSAGKSGGGSIFSAPGGGSGGGKYYADSNTSAGGAGGKTGNYGVGGGGAGGTSGGTDNVGNPGTAGTSRSGSGLCGDGGGGGASGNTVGGAGGAGGIPGGGGGGAGKTKTGGSAGAGGSGGRGEVIVISYF